MEQEQEIQKYWKWVDALITSMEVSQRSGGPDALWKHVGYKQFAQTYNNLVRQIASKVELPPFIGTYDLDNIKGWGDTMVPMQKQIFDSVHANASILRAYLRSISGVDTDELSSLRDFLQARLRSAVFEKPTKEREIQNALEQL
ncbi:MAG: hypothetical protein HYX73_08615 [Acidobacteria bacterium]|nr:hypothetical protein [Acidobacteriota bacterium]